MPHQCVKCGKLYPTASKELLQGCSCGGRFFFFVRDEALEVLKKETSELSKDDKKEIEHDVREIIGVPDEHKPVILDLESIRIAKPGKFEIDLVRLLKKKPVIYSVGEGKYMIDLPTTFQFMNKKRKK